MKTNTPAIRAVLEFPFAGLPGVFGTADIHTLASSYQRQIADLIDARSILKHTTLRWELRHASDTDKCRELVLLIGLQLTNQRLLDLCFDAIGPEDVHDYLAADRNAFVKACQDAPLRDSAAASGFALRVAAACRNQSPPQVRREIEQGIRKYLGGRLRKAQGKLIENDWRLSLPDLPRYDWEARTETIRARIDREKCGYTLILLRRSRLPSVLASLKELRMPVSPSKLPDVLNLDCAAYTGLPLNLEIRIGLDPASGKAKVADFIRCIDTESSE